jgi:predicted amidophosphoribosyltransferase
MAFPLKICVVCSEEFELRPDKPGFANRCAACSEPESTDTNATESGAKRPMDAVERRAATEANAARRKAIRDLLYRKDS